jgi:hypothetical protein
MSPSPQVKPPTASRSVSSYAHCADRRDAKGQMCLFTSDTHFVVFKNRSKHIWPGRKLRGVTKAEKLTLTDNARGSTSGSIDGTMAFDRKDYGMNKSIPFIKIANRVEVNVSLKWKRVSGAPPVFQQ